MTERPYRPSNGTEGLMFQEAWCDRCIRDQAFRESANPGAEESCPILANTMAYAVGDPEYPSEWRYGEDGLPFCAAFDDGKPRRCAGTIDMFTAPASPCPVRIG